MCVILYPKAKFACYPRCFLNSYFCIPVPYNEKDIFWVLVLRDLVGLHRTIQLQLLQHYWLGHRLGLLWYWMVCLGNKQRTFCHFWDCIHVLWKILKEMGIPDHLTCLLRNLYADQEATVRTVHGRTDWFQIGKGVRQGCILSPCLFNLYAEYIMRNIGLEVAQAGNKIARRNTITSDMQMTPPLWKKVKRN